MDQRRNLVRDFANTQNKRQTNNQNSDVNIYFIVIKEEFSRKKCDLKDKFARGVGERIKL